MLTIGITGTIGAGKGTIVEYLKTKGFKHYSAREVLLEEIGKRGMPPIRDSMLAIADEWRSTRAPSYIMEKLSEARTKDSGDAVIESQRAIGEIDFLRKNAAGFYLFAIDADPKTRYERIFARKSSTDNVTLEKFIEDEAKEMSNTEPWKTNLFACIKEADFVFTNNGSFEELQTQIDKVLSQISSQKSI